MRARDRAGRDTNRDPNDSGGIRRERPEDAPVHADIML